MKSRKDFFQAINGFPHSLAVYLTFTLDREVIEKIAENSYGNIVILHDFRQGVSLKNNWNNRIICIPVNAHRQHMQNCFHSKLALLKGDDKAKVLLGSANLSKDSFSREKEICFEADIDFNSGFYKSIINYIQSLIPNTHTSTDVLSNVVNKFRFSNEKEVQHSGISFVSNLLNSSISDKIRNHLLPNEKPIVKIASPFLSDNFKDQFIEFIEQVNPKEIQLFLRKNYPVPAKLKSFHALKLFQPKSRSTRNGFHAKLISIEYSNKEIVFIGSANFSQQGFFQNLNQGANEECGIIISGKQKHILDDWFNEGWEKPVSINEWQEDESLRAQSEVDLIEEEPYVWAERINSKEVLIFFHLPDKGLRSSVSADGHRLILTPRVAEMNIYQCQFNPKGERILINIGNSFSIYITIFSAEEFELRSNETGESLFFESRNIESINPAILQKAIEDEGIKISIMGAVVIEPPYLEQYYYNVKQRISILSRRTFFSDYHKHELESLLQNISGGEGIYFIAQLLKCFENKHQAELCNICKIRIESLLRETESLNLSYQSFNTFFKEWNKY
jgi:phosphatidylserine/phosphatidylglycerophosphate/cardiolipin synthase-like enzyme